MTGIIRIVKDVRGATAIEYGLIAALIAIAAIGGMNSFANSTTNMWGGVVNTMHTAVNDG